VRQGRGGGPGRRSRAAPLRGSGRHRQGDRPLGPDRAGAANGRARKRRARRPQGLPRDRRVKVAALYDVHGNVHALEAVLGEVQEERPDAIVYGGDVVYGPFPVETLELARSVEAIWIRGNC